MSLIELQLYDENPKLNHSLNSDIYSQHISDLSFSNISKSKFAEHYHFLCKFCDEVPIIKFVKRNKIKYKCKCKKSPRLLLIKDIFDYLLYSEEIDIELSKLKCADHEDEKYIFYCEACKKNICYKCAINCIEHKNRINTVALDKKTINKSKYIIQKLEEISKYSIGDDLKSEDFEEDNISTYKLVPKKYITNLIEKNCEYNDINENNISNEEIFIITKVKNNIENDINKEEMFNIMNENNDFEKNEEEEYYSLNLFSIIIDDYKNYPNYNHIETISNVEKYVSLSFGDYNEINLKYKFNKENIKYKSLELFGEVFVNNNKENCFLIINEKIMELNRYIRLSEIFEISNILINWPIQLEVKLIEQKNKVMNNMSFMLYEINTLLPSSDFSKFNTIFITKMSYMFYNCSSLTQLPDISMFNTMNVTDMNNMFYNCSSLTQLPDISKFNTESVAYMNNMFYNCSSLIELPDISKWNMKNIIDISNMFCNCESLVLIPDISNWNLSKEKVKKIDYLFKNCKSLSNLPKLSKLNINQNLFDFGMVEGCILLEMDYKEKDYVNEIKNCYKRIINKITSCLEKLLYLYYFLFFLFLLFLACYPIYSAFNLVEVSYSSKNPLEYFKLNNYSNITFIASYYNITNLTIIFEKFESEENFINYKINFTSINKDIKFESDLKRYKILSIILAILCTINHIVLIYIIFFNIINNSKLVLLINILFLSYIVSTILSIIILIITRRLNKSLTYFYSLIIRLFKVKISKFIRNEIKYLRSAFTYESINLFYFIFIICIVVFECKKSTDHMSIRTKSFLNKLIGGK